MTLTQTSYYSYEENERAWEAARREMLGEGSDDETGDEADDESGGASDEEEDEPEQESAEMTNAGGKIPTAGPIVDLTETELVNLRRTIYLTIMSSASFEECSHKLAKLRIPSGYEQELCNMLIECCANERSFQRYYGLMGQRFCMMKRVYQNAFDDTFLSNYTTIHRLETNKLRNVAKFFSHLLQTDALPWTCLEYEMWDGGLQRAAHLFHDYYYQY